jgi:threonyl-tRNA synthetase
VEKVPYALVIGGKEAEAKAVSVRSRAGGDEGVMPLETYLEKLRREVQTRALSGKRKACVVASLAGFDRHQI